MKFSMQRKIHKLVPIFALIIGIVGVGFTTLNTQASSGAFTSYPSQNNPFGQMTHQVKSVLSSIVLGNITYTSTINAQGNNSIYCPSQSQCEFDISPEMSSVHFEADQPISSLANVCFRGVFKIENTNFILDQKSGEPIQTTLCLSHPGEIGIFPKFDISKDETEINIDAKHLTNTYTPVGNYTLDRTYPVTVTYSKIPQSRIEYTSRVLVTTAKTK